MNKAVLFDLDGTLADTLADLASAVNYALRAHGYPERTMEQVREFIGNGSRELIRKSMPEHARQPETVEQVHETYLKRYYEYYLVDTRPYDGLPELIHRLAGEGVALGVVTNKPDAHARKLVERFFGDDFGVVIGTSDAYPTKPDPAMANRAMDALHADRSRTLFVGDSDVDIKTARNAGLPGVIVTWGFCSLEELRRNGAEHLADTPAMLEQTIRQLLDREP